MKSLVMVPIRTMAPVGAIGTYWADRHLASDEEVRLLAALADATSVAMENIEVYRTLEQRIDQRTAELARSQAALAAEHEALVEAQRQRAEMAALVAHDLKSPANGIMLACKARLRSPSLSDDDRRRWRSIEASADVINRLALDLVDLSRSEDGGLRPRVAELDVRGLLERVAQRMAPLAEAREQRIEVVTELHEERCFADDELLHRVLQNLIDNALRHNQSDAISVAARAHDERVQIRVVDQGPGVPEAMREAVFGKYTRLEPGANQAGHGLGLTFCRLAVEAHGGRIWIEPNAPRGAAFVVELPRSAPH